MKNLISFFIALISLNLIAKETPSTIKNVIVYQQGAKVTRIATANLPEGTTELKLSGITDNFQQSSVQCEMQGNAIIVSVKAQVNYLVPPESTARIKELEDSVKYLGDEIEWLKEEMVAFQKQLEVLEANKNIVTGEGKVSAIEMQDFVDYYGEKQSDIRKSMHDLNIYTVELKKLQTKQQQQLNELKGRGNNRTGEIFIEVLTKAPTKATITFSYVVNNAGWRPVYDLRASENKSEIDMVYKANVYQNTGHDWENINLEVSTGNPLQSNERPILNPWYIDFMPDRQQVYGAIQYKTKTAPSRMRESNMAFDDKMEVYPEEEDELAEYVVVQSSNQLNASYKIAHKNTILANGKEHLVVLGEYNVGAQFKYHTVPKINPSVFLIAKVGGYGKYNLLPGKANIFLDGAYISQTSINTGNASDTMLISFGRSNNITVERTVLADLEGDKFIGGNKLVTKGYEIKVVNNNNKEAQLEILDQLPVSRQEDIKVELTDQGGAAYTAKNGRLFWDLTLQPQKVNKVKFLYTVKYPKDRKITNF